MLPNTAATTRQSIAVPATTAGTTVTMVDVPGTLLEGVAITLVVIETVLIVDVVKCVWVSERCVPISDTLLTGGVTSELVTSVSLYTSDNCDDGVSGEYVDTVEQFMGITVSL